MIFKDHFLLSSSAKDDKPKADIGLILEGTYPYVRGGVSAWVHQIITSLPQVTFSLIFLGSIKGQYSKKQYELPKNVVSLDEHYLMEGMSEGAKKKPKRAKGNQSAFEDASKMHEYFKSHHQEIPLSKVCQVFKQLGSNKGIPYQDFLQSMSAWNMIGEKYKEYCSEPSFIDYFWSIRTMHAPLFVLAGAVKSFPNVKAIHSVSTGYAGLLGSMVKMDRNIPFVLTEHGIYTKERKIDLAQADWIHEHKDSLSTTMHSDIGYIRRLWINFFKVLGQITYQTSDHIISLYQGNQERQIKDGAAREKTMIIPNGISLERFSSLIEARKNSIPKVVGLIGRVVPIKDIKTFIRSMRTVCNTLPDVEGWIVGPEDEDEEYVAECKDLVSSLGLENNVKFLGFQNIFDIIPQLGLMVLTSISEALPLVILEGYASGLPCIASDVGACRELIEGGNDKDKSIGLSGRVVSIADPDATAHAIQELLSDSEQWYSAQKAGFERARQFYSYEMMISEYQKIYEKVLN